MLFIFFFFAAVKCEGAGILCICKWHTVSLHFYRLVSNQQPIKLHSQNNRKQKKKQISEREKKSRNFNLTRTKSRTLKTKLCVFVFCFSHQIKILIKMNLSNNCARIKKKWRNLLLAIFPSSAKDPPSSSSSSNEIIW